LAELTGEATKNVKEISLTFFCRLEPFFVSYYSTTDCEGGGSTGVSISIEIDTLEYQQTEKIETELKDVDRI
jgi:hypothetical protein